MARRSDMKALVDSIEASPEARERTKAILNTLSGQESVEDGCARLGIGRTRFQELRERMLEGAVAALEERPAGRPRCRVEERCPEREAPRRCVAELESELRHARAELLIARSGVGEAVAARLAAKGGRR